MTNPPNLEIATDSTRLADTAAATLNSEPGAATPGDRPEDAPDGDELARGDAVGRYVVLGPIGHGGMGAVYAAYDPELDRKVALKLLLRRLDRGPGDGARLLREAQAMAQLSHPNVVAVHDVGALRGRVWIAMEFVDGQTLSAWLKAARRGWRERLAVFLRAGEGLQAAHAAGLVHRDFKPDNVMIGADERVRVMDFGLVRAERGAARGAEQFALRGATALDVALTSVGAVIGTPRYMAPEQWTGGETDARTDQFSFCVALWEALYGLPPFAGARLPELSRAVTRGTITPPPASARVPKWIRRALLRGLAVDPRQRWPSMAALLAELRRDPTRRDRLLAAAVVAALAAAGFAGWQRVERAQQVAACDVAANEIDEVWSAGARERVRAAALATGAGFATTGVDRALAWLDVFAQRWSEARRLNCLRAYVQPDLELLRRADACLDERRAELGELVVLLAAPDSTTVAGALAAAPGLPSPLECADLPRLRREAPADEPTGADVAELRRRLATAAALSAAVSHEAAATLAEAVARDADAQGAPLLAARAHLEFAAAAVKLGKLEQGRDSYVAAFHGGLGLGADVLAARSAAAIADYEGLRRAQPDHRVALEWLAIADTLLTRHGVPDDDPRRVFPQQVRCRIHNRRGEEEAIACSRRVIDIQRKTFGREHPASASTLMDLGDAYRHADQFALALDAHRRALALLENAFGPDYADLSLALERIGMVLVQLGAIDDAIATQERAVAVRERSQGNDTVMLGAPLAQLSFAQTAAGRYEEALRTARRALAIQERHLGPEHLHLVATLNSTAGALRALGRYREALADWERALAIVDKAASPSLGHLDALLTSIGRVHGDLGDHDAALAAFRRILALHEERGEVIGVARRLISIVAVHLARRDYAAALDEGERALAILERDSKAYETDASAVLTYMARARIGLGQPELAIPLCERALDAIEAAEPNAFMQGFHGETMFTFAQALWATKRDRPRALDLAHRARPHLQQRHDMRDRAAELEAWLAAHDEPR